MNPASRRARMFFLLLSATPLPLAACSHPPAPPPTAASATAVAPQPARMEVRFDPAKNETLVRLTPPRPPTESRPTLIAGATHPGRTATPPAEVLLGFERSGPAFQYEGCAAMALQGEGQALVEVPLSRDTQIGSGQVTEILTGAVPFPVIKALTTFAQINVVLCGERLTLTPEEQELLRRFVAHFQPR